MYSAKDSDLKKVVYFCVLYKYLKETQNIKWRELTSFFKNNSFDQAIYKIENAYNIFQNQLQLEIESVTNVETQIKTRVNAFYQKLKEAKINAVVSDNFQKYKALQKIKYAYFLFYIGDESILQQESRKFISVVGSRKTPNSYQKWISQNVPKDKIIVSGLANGADLMGHMNAIQNNQKIVVFPARDLLYPPQRNIEKSKVWNYALKNGIIISAIIPGTKSFDKNILLRRNKWMAQMVNKTYAVYFDGISGTLGQLLEVAKNKKGLIYMPKKVFEKNEDFLKNHKNFNLILEKVKK